MPKSIVDRARVASDQQWNTTHLFASDAAWDKACTALTGNLAAIKQWQGKLGQGSAVVNQALTTLFEGKKQLHRLYSYACRKHDEDTRVPLHQGQKEIIGKLATEFAAATAYFRPELLSLSEEALDNLITDPTLSEYCRFLSDLRRLKAHILSQPEENILASTSLMARAGYEAYSTFSSADMTFPQVPDEKGKPSPLSQSLFSRYRTSPDRKVRKTAFDAFFGTFHQYRNTIASLLSAQVNAHITMARLRHYPSAIASALDADEIPLAVYDNMIRAVNRHLPALHRYLSLRRKRLKLKQLYYYDLYPPMIERVSMRFAEDKARQLVIDASAPMGRAYVDALRKGLDPKQGWVDLLPNQGKRSGAYMDGSAYDVHPYVLCNHLGDYNSVSTLAHEMGHAMHSYFSNQHQPYPTADYSIFVAEVASTLSEAFLSEHLLSQTTKKEQKLYLLGEVLEGFRATLFRQCLFAEFERALYQRAEANEPLTADAISALYLGIVRRYYGHDEGLVIVDDRYAIEWACVPHFYYNFYVFQYVTGITAATALSEMIRTTGTIAAERYMKQLLCAGSSAPAIEILKNAGVDLTTEQPYDLAMEVFTRALSLAESI